MTSWLLCLALFRVARPGAGSGSVVSQPRACMQIAAGLRRAPESAHAPSAPPPGAPSFLSAGGPQTTPAPRGPRRPPQDPPARPGTRDPRPVEADAHPPAPPAPRLPGEPAPPRSPGECAPRSSIQPLLPGDPTYGRPVTPHRFPRRLQPLVSPGHRAGARRPPCQPLPASHQARPRKIVFEDELLSWALLGARKPAASGPGVQTPRPHSVPDYEL